MTDAEIGALLKSGASAERVAAALTHEPWFKQALTGVGTGAQDITLRSAKQYAAELPQAARKAVKLGIDLSNPRIADAMVTMNSRATAQLTKDAAETMRQVVKTGMEAGKGSKAIAKTLRDSIGLAPNQEQAVRHFEEMLRAGDRTALSRALRDKRYDATLNRLLGPGGKGLSEAQIKTMGDAYRRKMVAFNANTQARTLANDAQRAGQRLAWEDAIGKGVVDRANLWKQRVSMRDGKVRDEHVEWDGEVRRFDELYSSGEMVVGESEFGCRCFEILFEDATGERFGAGQGPRSVQGQAPVPPVAPPAVPVQPHIPPVEEAVVEESRPVSGRVPKFATKEEAVAFSRTFIRDLDPDLVAAVKLEDLQALMEGAHNAAVPYGHVVNEIGFKTTKRQRRAWAIAIDRRNGDTAVALQKTYVRNLAKEHAQAKVTYGLSHAAALKKAEANLADPKRFAIRPFNEKKLASLRVATRWTVGEGSSVPFRSTVAHEVSHTVYFRYRLENEWRTALAKRGTGAGSLEAYAVSEYGASSATELFAEVGALVAEGRQSEIPAKILEAFMEVTRGLGK